MFAAFKNDRAVQILADGPFGREAARGQLRIAQCEVTREALLNREGGVFGSCRILQVTETAGSGSAEPIVNPMVAPCDTPSRMNFGFPQL